MYPDYDKYYNKYFKTLTKYDYQYNYEDDYKDDYAKTIINEYYNEIKEYYNESLKTEPVKRSKTLIKIVKCRFCRKTIEIYDENQKCCGQPLI